MAANYKTIEKVVKILDEETNQETVVKIVRRLRAETLPSGNASYDETVRRLCAAVNLGN